jgi:hypothetical protein
LYLEEIISWAMSFFTMDREREIDRQMLARWFVLVLPTIVPMDWVVYVLFCRAKAVI